MRGTYTRVDGAVTFVIVWEQDEMQIIYSS